jgi:hypothetical protein
MGRTWTLAVALAALLMGSVDTPARAQAKKSDAVVKVKATADKPGADGKQTLTITLDIERPWHLYANPVGNEDFASAQTTISVSARAKPEDVKIDYPPGKLLKDPAGDFKVYEGQVTIKAHLRRARGDTGPLEVSVKLQACNDKSCLLPATVKVTVP